ncbi:Rid family hydrolase [Thiomonas intermedia]|uniref:chorismate transformation enzyme, FkbO/Hyg5 family n=1 Tax=Thiomonas intermedia TaxID=926 RepID=UPI001FE6C666|nr:Rid family hydrolase [Thiomonas intermedia]
MLQLHHLSADGLAQTSAAAPYACMGAACFGAGGRASSDDAALCLAHVRVEPLADQPEVCEAWLTRGPLQHGRAGPMRWSGNADLVFGVVEIAEHARPELPDSTPPLQAAAREAYAALFGTLDVLGYPYLLRVWNHVPDINGTSHGLERYRLFNIGRQDAFLAHGRTVDGGSVPAASALGAATGAPLLVYGIAARQAPTAIENPRQVSAYDYPRDYGPRSPTFSRASLARLGSQHLLFISGTASIVGHRTLHAHDVAEQTRETLRNIDAVLKQAHEHGAAGISLADLHFKVYVRHGSDWPVIRAELRRAVGANVRAIALQADVCRQDLLVEIEASGIRCMPGPICPGNRDE